MAQTLKQEGGIRIRVVHFKSSTCNGGNSTILSIIEFGVAVPCISAACTDDQRNQGSSFLRFRCLTPHTLRKLDETASRHGLFGSSPGTTPSCSMDWIKDRAFMVA
mmetsp:Transcript_39299/g.113449  ORF Transcript_39299/g.113449 Transcript_39299/m.113449 type:complete len:106 (-) Transcript_39299:540-857(-)